MPLSICGTFNRNDTHCLADLALLLFCKPFLLGGIIVSYLFLCLSCALQLVFGRNVCHMAGFKLKAVEYAVENGNRAAGRHFEIDEVRVH